MPSLAEYQRRMRDAVVNGDIAAIAPLLTAGDRDVARRADIHRRHYQTSLVAAVMGRFPATAWLVGSPALEAAAVDFVHAHPPTAPCIAEYGRRFPAWLAVHTDADRVPYVEAFAELDWQLGRLSVSVDVATLDPARLAALGPHVLADAVLALQDGTCYIRSDWPIDMLMQIFLGESAAVHTRLMPQPVWLESRGNRGCVSITRLAEAEWEFRHALQQMRPIGVAVERAWQFDPKFDPGVALANLFAAALVVRTSGQVERES